MDFISLWIGRQERVNQSAPPISQEAGVGAPHSPSRTPRRWAGRGGPVPCPFKEEGRAQPVRPRPRPCSHPRAAAATALAASSLGRVRWAPRKQVATMVKIVTVKTKAHQDQKPGTSGLRKR